MTRPVRARDEEWSNDVCKNDDNSDDTASNEYSSEDRHSSSYDYKFKICLLGESNVGKTSLINRYLKNYFNENEDNVTENENNDELNFSKTRATIGMDCMSTIKIMRGHKIQIEIWDTAGQERFNAMTTSYLRGANAIILVYDMTDRSTFEAIETKWLDFLKNNLSTNDYGSMDARIAIVANKLDLNDDRIVPKKDGVKLSTKNNCRFFEASAKSGKNVRELFRSICDSICDYWCDLRGNPNFFPADIDTKRIKLNKNNKQKERSTCNKC